MHSNNSSSAWDNYKKNPYQIPAGEGHLSKRQTILPRVFTVEDVFPKYDRWSIGYSNTFDSLQQLAKQAKASSYPPYDVVNYDDDTTQVSIAAAGFDKDDITVSVTEGVLQVNGAKKVSEVLEAGPEVTSEHRGIAQRPFHLTFAIAEYYEVVGASLNNGMLNISLRKNVPDEKRPKIIDIN